MNSLTLCPDHDCDHDFDHDFKETRICSRLNGRKSFLLQQKLLNFFVMSSSEKLIYQKAVRAIQKEHVLLVFPLNNRADIPSVWQCLHPKTKMRWEWDEGGDNRVAQLWFLREKLSRSCEVVYSKWFQNRATFFSREIFVQLLAYYETVQTEIPRSIKTQDSKKILEILEMDSPLSTKQIKQAAELQGRDQEARYNRAMKRLWSKLWIVAFGEFEDSSFPSLGIGATQNLFEDMWNEAKAISVQQAQKNLQEMLGENNVFWKFAQKVHKLAP